MNKCVYVIWHDAHAGCSTWNHLEDMTKDDDPYVVHSVGWVLDIGAGGKSNHLSITQSWSDDDAVDSVLHIPNAMVQRVIEVRGASEQPKGRRKKDRTLGRSESSLVSKSSRSKRK